MSARILKFITGQDSVSAAGRQSPAERRRAEREREALVALRQYKRERGLSCEELATEFGVSVDSIERYLSGRRPVPGHIVVGLRRAA